MNHQSTTCFEKKVIKYYIAYIRSGLFIPYRRIYVALYNAIQSLRLS